MKKPKYKITILVAVYNAKEYLKRCLDHLVNQTCDKSLFEVLMVDDCSTDGAGDLCEKYANKYDNFRVIHHKKNTGGPSTARNEGIALAEGKYIFFCDTDDFFGKDAIRRLVKWTDLWQPDILLVKMGETGRKDYPRSMFDQNYESITPYNFKAMRTLGPWKCYRVEFLRQERIEFPLNIMYEDGVFNIHSFLCAKKISIASDYDYYYWTIREDGTELSQNKTADSKNYLKLESRIKAFQYMNQILDAHLDKNQNCSEINMKLMSYVYKALQFVALNSGTQEQLNELFQLTKGWYQEKYAVYLNMRQYIVNCLFQKNQEKDTIVECCLRVNKDSFGLGKFQDKFYLTYENHKVLDMTNYLRNNSHVTLHEIQKKENKIIFKIQLYSILKPADLKQAYFLIEPTIPDGKKIRIPISIVGEEEAIEKSVKSCSQKDLLYPKYDISITFDKKKVVELFSNYHVLTTLEMYIHIGERNFPIRLEKEIRNAFFEICFQNHNMLYLADSPKDDICLRVIPNKVDYCDCPYLVVKNRPLKSRTIWGCLKYRGFKLAHAVTTELENGSLHVALSPLKRYIYIYIYIYI